METRICSQCKLEKPLSKDFFNTRDKLGKKFRTDCKICQNEKQSEAYKKKYAEYSLKHKEYRKSLRANNQKLLWEFLSSHPCEKCGEINPVVLELHHLNDKKYQIADIIYCHTWDSIFCEIQKCQVLCSNCHKKVTAKDLGFYSYIDGIEQYLV